MNKAHSILTVLSLPVITGAFLAAAAFSPAQANECNREVDLQGTVSKNVATVTNHSTNDSCVYEATLAIYDVPKGPETFGWIEAQTLVGSKTVSVKAGETVTIKVDGNGPSCRHQSDLIRGSEVLTPPLYRNAMAVEVYTIPDSECKPTTTSTGGTPNGTSTNTPNTSANLAPTGDIVLVYSFILAGFATLIAGIFLRKAGK